MRALVGVVGVVAENVLNIFSGLLGDQVVLRQEELILVGTMIATPQFGPASD